MDWLTALPQHPASALVAVAIAVLLVRLALALTRRSGERSSPAAAPPAWSRYVACFFSGVLFTNFLAHFPHGVSAEHFPAPFGFTLGSDLAEHLSNVVWGFVNLVLGFVLFQRGDVAAAPGSGGKAAFFAGVLTMGVFLAVVFSR